MRLSLFTLHAHVDTIALEAFCAVQSLFNNNSPRQILMEFMLAQAPTLRSLSLISLAIRQKQTAVFSE